MVVITRIDVHRELIDWAFEITDLSLESQHKVLQDTKWLQENFTHYLQPTVKQLGSFATHLHVPFGDLLLDKAPKLEDIRLAFRTQENAPAQVSLTVRDIIYEMQRKQAWFKENSQIATHKLAFIGSAAGNDVNETLKVVNRYLVLAHFPSPRDLFKDLRNQLAKIGILVMQKGGAGLGTKRPLEVSELRAFVLLDDFAPLIFINQKDSYTARIFSLIHEFIHILHGTDELLSGNDRDIVEERQINKVAAAFLMPILEFKVRFDSNNVDRTARYFGVSPQAVAIRARGLGLINSIDDVDYMPPAVAPKSSSGNQYNIYNTALSYNDRRYMSVLVAAQENGTVLPTEAASLIGISYKMLDRTIEIFNEREEAV
jgi:Zn-dependent peptidase ImmA (M78 family)